MDYFTKHFAPNVYQVLRQRYIHTTNLVIDSVLQTLCNSLPARASLSAPVHSTDGHVFSHADVTIWRTFLLNPIVTIIY